MILLFDNVDIFNKVLSYIKDYHSFYLLNKHYKSLLPRHKVIKYKDLYSCSMYKNTNKYKAICILKKNYFSNSIHFENKQQLNISKKYLYRKGLMNHYCCNGRGVLFINKDYYSSSFM